MKDTVNTEQDDKALGQRMVEAEAKLKPVGWGEPVGMGEQVAAANAIKQTLDRHRERDERSDSLNDKLDRLEVLLEELLRRIG